MKMKELRLRLITGVNGMVDEYFGANTITDNLINATLKILIKQNEYKLDQILNLFADENGEIDGHMVLEEYAKALGSNGVIIDIRDFIKSEQIKRLLPNKSLSVKKEDIERMLL